ncbi:hypothetical protein [Streptomyces sp. NPDC000410]|uniref:hypothetical protein n=1 Tax=Streptomyces sp. NPDC000410 TaxID=3154254 RepID=UPI003321B0AC
MAQDDTRPVYHPAGHDHALRVALQELRSGRWVSMRDLLAETPDWALWTQRTQILAAAAAGSDVVRAWSAEEPHSTAVAVMSARVAVERAVRARREGHRHTRDLWREAWDACADSARARPDDPVPWVCLLALAQLDEKQQMSEHRMPPPGPMLPTGPWALLTEADKRDPGNREAYHRMLQFLYVRQAGAVSDAVNFAQWAASAAAPGSPLHALPLYVRVERYRREQGHRRALDLYWVAEDAVRDAERTLHGWFDHAEPEAASLLDLSQLAHALWGAQRFADAGRVFRALGPYYTTMPWAYRTPDPLDQALAEELFLRARERCLAAAQDDPGA